MLVCVVPYCWIAVFPFVYLIVNVVFLTSAYRLWSHLHGRKSTFYTNLAPHSAVASWFAPLFVGGIGVGYFAWTASIALMAIATYIPVNSDVSTMAQRYFVKRGKTVKGPFSLKKIQHLSETKKLKDNDLISISDHGPWKAPAQFEALQKSQPIESKVSLDSEGS